MRKVWLVIIIMAMCISCKKEYDHHGRTPLVELNGRFLYYDEIQSVLPLSLSASDSVSFVEQYKLNWMKELLLMDKATHNIPNNAEIDRLVENYRKSLILHTYQQELINQNLANEVTEEEMLAYFEEHQTLFKAERPLLKGLFIKVPLSAPQLTQLRRWYKDTARVAVENLEKYGLQHAVKYEYFYDKWVSIAEILDWVPYDEEELTDYLTKRQYLELKDTTFYYFLNVTDYRPVGAQEPFEFAQSQVKDILLNMRRMDYIEQVKNELYEEALEENKIKIVQ
ncbi:MAG: peptidyl-prolyl cis-trans isomerase [Mediterranea massiliensis]|nr:peptidyl-prolyl cis-trans isomerase [Mediterranea massiliensis]MBO5382636.1 peptidyl-prolyl cis-trans isomerase [Bacteroides sp.]